MARIYSTVAKPRALVRVLAAFLSLCFLYVTAHAQDIGSNPASQALHELFAGEWDYLMEQHPTWASTLGDRRWNDRWSDVSFEAISRRHDHNIEVLAKLGRIERAALSPADQLNYDLFQRDYREEVDGFQFHGYLLPMNQLSGVQTVNELTNSLRFVTVKDYEDWLARLMSLPARV